MTHNSQPRVNAVPTLVEWLISLDAYLAGARNLKAETALCLADGHCHSDPHIHILRFEVFGHTVIVESERDSGIYCAWVDDDERLGMNSDELDAYLNQATP